MIEAICPHFSPIFLYFIGFSALIFSYFSVCMIF